MINSKYVSIKQLYSYYLSNDKINTTWETFVKGFLIGSDKTVLKTDSDHLLMNTQVDTQ